MDLTAIPDIQPKTCGDVQKNSQCAIVELRMPLTLELAYFVRLPDNLKQKGGRDAKDCA
ncbi:hypothetical protein N182_35750 [Sinorhizobium sp. GL2]|nr:hypothetical protein N182_35750 [Sinorhizobium sp. GL2]